MPSGEPLIEGAGGVGSTGRPETPSGGVGLPELAPAPVPTLARAIAAEEESLLTCVHCGFCLPACPTYTRLGDENDSPRGRLYLMRAVVEGRLDAGSDAFQTHIDRCLGCRACEPVCPSGVPYGSLLELARSEAADERAPTGLTRRLLDVMADDRKSRAFSILGRVLRFTGLPALAARVLPDRRELGAVRLAAGMLAASGRWRGLRKAEGGGADRPAPATRATGDRTEAGMLLGCVQQGLFGRVNDATRRVLRANGVSVRPVEGQGCCGALHAHAGDLDGARALARRNVEAFEASGVESVVVNAAGCGALMKEYGHLLAGDPAWASRAALVSSRVRDVSEILADRGPRPGAPLRLAVTYDAPCHLLHAQGVERPPLQVLEAIPGLDLVPLEKAGECCGGAGIYGVTHPQLGGRITGDKVEAVRRSGADVVATGNPGCAMQIGAGLRMAGEPARTVHPVELLDESYRRAGFYGPGPA